MPLSGASWAAVRLKTAPPISKNWRTLSGNITKRKNRSFYEN